MTMLQRLATTLAAMTLTACVSTDNVASKSPLIPDKALKLTASTRLTPDAIIAGALLFVIIDPLAPNWQVELRPLGGPRYAVALTMKRFTTGGDGEAHQVMQRAAERLVRDSGAAGYRITAFSEGIESTVPVARRVANGTLELL